MPRVPKEVFQSIVFIYPSEQDAIEDTRFGGTGFLIAVPVDSRREEWGWKGGGPVVQYLVTAAHVVQGKPRVFLRINDGERGGVFPPVPIDADQWVMQLDENGLPKSDLAVLPIDLPMQFTKGPWPIWITLVVDRNAYPPDQVGPGDDVLMVGRFVDRGGKKQNTPASQFGNISLMPDPDEPITLKRGQKVDAFLVEMRSRGGFSGSPVYTFDEDMKPPAPRTGRDVAQLLRDSNPWPRPRSPRLLGIEQGQYPLYLKVEKKGQEVKDLQVHDRSAMCIVIPSWHLLDLLMDERLVEMRKNRKDEADDGARPDEESSEEQPFTKADFEEALRRTTRRVEDPKPKREG